jgi:hypothetical protein
MRSALGPPKELLTGLMLRLRLKIEALLSALGPAMTLQ